MRNQIKQLTEDISMFLNEISAETRQQVVDARKAQMDKAIAKYANSKSLADRHSKLDIKPNERVDVVNEINTHVNAKLMDELQDLDLNELEADGFIVGGIFVIPEGTEIKVISIQNKEINPMVKIAIPVIGIQIELPLHDITENTNAVEKAEEPQGPSKLERILAGEDVELEPNETVADIVAPHLNELSVEDAVKLFHVVYDRYGRYEMNNSLYPSGWDYQKFGGYPAILAQALVRLNGDIDNFTDLYNFYYKSYARSASKETLDIFANVIRRDDLASNIAGEMHSYEDDEAVADMAKELMKDYPDIADDLLLAMENILDSEEYEKLFGEVESKVARKLRKMK